MISEAMAQETIEIAAGTATAAAQAPGTGDAFMFNMGLIFVMFILFYFLLIRPQQKRMKQQREMLDGLKKGDKVVTGGGLVGKVSKIIDDEEVEIELAEGFKVKALRYTISTKVEKSAKVDTSKKEK